MPKKKDNPQQKGHPALDPLAALGAARMRADVAAKGTKKESPAGSGSPHEKVMFDGGGGKLGSAPSTAKKKIQTGKKEDGLKPRIVRDGLIDEIILWIRMQLTMLEQKGASPDEIARISSDLATIQYYKEDLVCLERSIQLVNRDDADPLVSAASRIRESIIDIYENLASSG